MAGKASGMQVSVSAEEWKKKQASSSSTSSESQSASKSAAKLVRDSNRFIQSAKKDLNKENYFDAADYFEERKKQAEDLKRRAVAAASNLEANAGSYTSEYYDSMAEYLSNFDTMVDDVLSNYKPSLDSREGMRAYEDEMIAAMERNSRYVDERKPHNGTLLSYNEDTEDFIPDYSYRSVNSNWTPEQRYTLGHLQLQNPEEAQKYATEVNKYLSNMGMYAEQERQKQELEAMDLNAAKKEIDALRAEVDNFYFSNDYTADAEYRQKRKELSDKEQIYNQAKRLQEGNAFDSVTGNDDFAAKSGYVSTEAQNFRDRMFSEYGMGYNDLTYEYINDPERVQAYNDEFTRRMLESNYDLMQNEEVAIYNYLYATEGKKTAQAYLDDIADTLSKRRSDQTFSTIKGNTAKELLVGINAGVNQFLSKTKSLFSDDDYIPTTATQMTSQRVLEDLQDRAAIKKAETGEGSLAPLAYDIITTTSNMLPSMAAGALANVVLPGSGAYVGSALMGASAAGGAYQEAINSGYNKEQARTYSTMVGVAETGMEAMLGLVGGGMPDAIKKKAIDAVDGAIAKFAIEQGANMISEGFEEGLQEVISPWIENVFLMAEKENADIKDVAYASLLGALSTLPFAAAEGGKTAVTSWASRKAAPETAAAPTAEVNTFQTPVETPKVSTEGKAMQISTKHAVDVKDFASMSDNGATIMTNDGDVVDYDDVSFADQKQANQFYAVRSLPGLDTEAANDLLTAIQNADAGQDTDSVVGIRDAYRIGYFNQDVKGLDTGDASVLSPKLRQAVYDIGVRQNQAEAAVKASATSVTTKPSEGYKKVTLEGNIKLDTNQKSQVEFIDKFSDKVSKTSVHVFESYVKNGKRYYKDSSGKEVLAPNGKYVNGEIWVDLKAGDKGEGLILNTFAHEIYHHIESQNKAGANKLASWVSKNMGIKNVDAAVEAQIRKARAAGYGEKYFRDKGMSAEQARNEVYARAMSDFVADSLETMFTRGDPADAIAQLYKEDRTLFDQIKEFIDKFISQVKQFYSDKTISAEGAAVAQLENFQELQRMFMEAAKGAGENYQAALDTVVKEGAKPVDSDAIQTDGAFVTDGEGTLYSIRSMKEDIAEGKMFDDLMTYCNWTQKQVDTLRNQLNDLVVYMTPFRNILDLNETYGREGRRFSPYKPNSDPLYKISMDFSTLCSKRLLTQYVIENLQVRENRPMSAEEQMAIRDMLNEYRKQEKGLQVACAMCYVEAARLKSPKQMQKWMNDPETYMRNFFADKDPDFAAYIKGKQEDFKESRGYARNTPKKEMNSKDVAALNKIRPRLRAEYQPSAGEQVIIDKAKSLPNSTYLTAANLANLSESDPTIYAAYTSFVRTATRSKSLETDEPYYYGDSRRDNGNGIVVTDSFIEEVNRENGMRFSSWSDWRIQHMLDYITAVIDNAVRGAAMHGYTKFPEEVRVLGKTGMMFNMSGVAGTQTGLNEDGSLSFSETESIDKNEAVKLREEFPETAGLQCIGVSDTHIVELLKSDIIDYVIPYHVSGLNKGLRSMANIQGWKDYTSTQHASIDKNAKLSEAKDQEHWHEEPVFSEFFVGYNTGKTGIEAMRASAKKYKQMCAERGLKPKFEEFKKEPNYWKLLIDRKMINQKTGELIQQKPVTPTFDFDTIKAVVDRHVKNYDSNMEARALNHIVENWDSIPKRIRDLKKQGGKKTVKKSVDNLSNQTLAAQPTESAEIGQFSLRNEKPLTNREILEQLDIEKRRPQEKGHLNTYRERLAELREKKPKLAEVNARIQELSADPVKNKAEISKLNAEARSLKRDVDSLNRKIREQEQGPMFVKIVGEERLKAQKQQTRDVKKSYKEEQRELVKEMQLEQRVIREELTGKKSDITIMEREFVRIAKQYEKLDERTGKKSAKDAKVIAELKAALKEEAKSHSEDSKIWEREFNRLLKDYETSGRQIERLEATILRQRATAKARVEGRRNTEMRHKIQKKVNELDQLLRHGSKHRNVPEFLQDSVAAVLQAINMEVRDGDQRRKSFEATMARYDRQIAMTSDPAKVAELIEKRNEYEAKGDQFANRMEKLQAAYKQIREDNTGIELDEGIAGHLDSLFETVGNTPLGQMNAAQLDAVNDILNVTMATVRNANKLLAEERSAGVLENSKDAVLEIRSAGETKKTKTRLRKNLEQFGWNNLKPSYVFDVIGSKTLTNLYESLRSGEDTLAVDLDQAKKFFQEQWKKNGGKEWDMEKKWKFESTSGKSFELDLNQIMSLYAMSKDKDARSHLRVGGFAFDSDYQTKEDINIGPVKIPVKVESSDASAYNLSDEILGEIISTLTPKQRAFADAMQAYLSDTMAAKGNEVSLKKYGIRLFKKKDYFPIRVADQFMAKAREQQAGDRKLKDSGFTKERKPEAKNPVVLSAFTEIWAEHVDEMSLYHSFVLPLDDFNRVLNYHDAFVEGQEAVSVVEAITNAFGKGATNYIDQLIKDVNGGIKGGSTVSFANSLVSKAKKAQTMASLSVAIQQPSSIIRAMSTVDAKYFIGPKVTEKTTERTWEEIKRYAPIAIIKEMGGYDTNVGKSTVDYLTDTSDYETFGEKFKAIFTDSNYRDEQLGRLPAFMDETSWSVIWNAVKREQRDLHPNMDVKSDAFMKTVANRFTEVITRTQVYDSVFSRSGLMRDRKSDLAKMTTSFMAEPTTTANMLAVSILQASRGDIPKKQAVKTTASIVASLALNSALVSIIYAMRDDDEDKRYDEKWVENFRNKFFESLNPVEYIPYYRDIYNVVVKGYDVERADMELFGDLENALRGLHNDDLTAWEKTENVIGAIGNLLGVPVKNILRDVKGFVQTLGFAWDDRPNPKTKTGTYMAWRGMDLNDKEQMILAIQSGDEEHLQRVFGRFESQQKAESALQSAIKAKYLEDGLTAEETEEMLTTYFDRDDAFEIYWLMEEWDYAKANDGSSDGYTKYGSLYEAIETGDFESEIARFLEHGADASTIRSQITREYRKQYLADETAREDIREKLMPVYEATGMYASEVEDKFNDWDFEAEYGMTYSNFKAEYREGNVTEAEMRGAMDFYGLYNYEIEEGIRDLNKEIKFLNKYGMSLSEMKDAYDNGDLTRNELINALVFSGKTKTEATEEVAERDLERKYGIEYAKLDDAYKYNDISRSQFYNAMREHGATQQEADEAILGYDWLKKNVKKYPDLAISDAKRFVINVSDKMEERTLTDYGVSVDAYLKYKEGAKDCPGVDADGDGKIDSYSKAKQLFAMIDQLPISDEAKDGLALITNAESTLRKYAPWRK